MSYFDHVQNYIRMEENLKTIVCLFDDKTSRENNKNIEEPGWLSVKDINTDYKWQTWKI